MTKIQEILIEYFKRNKVNLSKGFTLPKLKKDILKSSDEELKANYSLELYELKFYYSNI